MSPVRRIGPLRTSQLRRVRWKSKGVADAGRLGLRCDNQVSCPGDSCRHGGRQTVRFRPIAGVYRLVLSLRPCSVCGPMAAGNESAEEEAWCASERDRVVAYLAAGGLNHGEVGEWPAWHVWPHVAVWAVESVSDPGWVGWWAISGDLPTDYTTCGPERHPREGVRDIAQRWRASVSHVETDKPASGWRIGSPEDQEALAPLLASRADLLLAWVADDSLWED